MSKIDDWVEAPADHVDDWEEVPTPTGPSMLESAHRGFAGGGLSLGFGDELSGLAGAAAGKLGLVPDQGYDYYRDYARQHDKEAQAANPKTFGASSVAGALPTAFIPGLNAAGAGLAGTAARAGLQGAIAGAGSTENDLSSASGLKDIAAGAGLGAAGGAAGYGLGKSIEKGLEKGSGVLGELGSALKGETSEATRENPFTKDIFSGTGGQASAVPPVGEMRDKILRKGVELGKDFTADAIPFFNTAKNAINRFGSEKVVNAANKFGDDITSIGISLVGKGMDKIGDILKQAPQSFGKFAPALQAAAQRGTQGLAATHFILQQTQPEYQDVIRNMDGTNN